MTRRPASQMNGTRVDPLIDALITRLPPANAAWPHEQQVVWLEMMKMAIAVLYGAPAADDVQTTPARSIAARTAGPRFVIDEDGFARRSSGERVMPGDVTDILYDKRGDLGDLGAIVWADGSTGVKGLHLDISSAVN